jgi:hypothetical protein
MPTLKYWDGVQYVPVLGLSSADYVAKAGSTMTGALTTPALTITGGFAINKAAGITSNIEYQSANLLRWTIGKTNAAETGSNAGSDLAVSSWKDDGTYLATPISINRSTGIVTFSKKITASGGILAESIGSSDTYDNYICINAATLFLTTNGSTEFNIDRPNTGSFARQMWTTGLGWDLGWEHNGAGAAEKLTLFRASNSAKFIEIDVTTGKTDIQYLSYQASGSVTPSANWASYGGAYANHVTRHAGMVTLELSLQRTVSAYSTVAEFQVATVPVGFRPASGVTSAIGGASFTVAGVYKPAYVMVKGDGSVWIGHGNGTLSIAVGQYLGGSVTFRQGG